MRFTIWCRAPRVKKVDISYVYSILRHELDWVEVDIQSVARGIVARMIGPTAYRNEEWLSLSIQYPLDTFQTAFSLRIFPRSGHTLLARLLPSRYRLQVHRRRAERIMKSLMDYSRIWSLFSITVLSCATRWPQQRDWVSIGHWSHTVF
jgi:hypothetical protein